jgi:hypothetical protein
VTTPSAKADGFVRNARPTGPLAAADALRVRADGSQSFESIARFDATQNQFVATPLDLGPETDRVFLLLFGTGIRFRSAPPAVGLKIGGGRARPCPRARKNTSRCPCR